jgi:hypothetical protein
MLLSEHDIAEDRQEERELVGADQPQARDTRQVLFIFLR